MRNENRYHGPFPGHFRINLFFPKGYPGAGARCPQHPRYDLEIIDSRRPFEATQELMYNIAYFVLDSGIHLSDGETIGLSATQRLKISHSPGVFPEGETIKIKF
ncbi:MAG: DUF4261 domain-containing protein [Phaeodactylibacter sp.]|nr:DUF4261 domain-containing protein [Phaeodactylibacter sp.]